MRVPVDHLFRAVPNPLFDDHHRRSRHHQRTDPVMPEAVHTTTFQAEIAEQWVKELVQHDAVDERRAALRAEHQPFNSAVKVLL